MSLFPPFPEANGGARTRRGRMAVDGGQRGRNTREKARGTWSWQRKPAREVGNVATVDRGMKTPATMRRATGTDGRR